ncbi:hypothetical protein [Burkholderia sp. LMG 21824]|uniref:hypothetical protein n=1 Tax=Burkholderia sp. LMG 21824 TaxID=3158172 RepID=UPI003C2E5C0F
MLPRSYLDNTLRTQIENLQGFDFQDFVTDMLFVIHGAKSFTNLRPVRDGGCDGLITSEGAAIACYAPGAETFSKWKKKVSSDYALYKNRWAHEFPDWRFFINHEPGPNHLELVKQLHGDSGVTWGLSRIHALINELAFGKRTQIYKKLRVPTDAYARHFISTLLDDLIARKSGDADVHYANQAPDPTEKIRANFRADRVAEAVRLMRMTLNQQMDVAEVLAGFDSDGINHLKVRIVSDYAALDGPTDGDRLLTLATNYGHKYNADGDDELQTYIHALLFHVFSQCLIGKPPGNSDVAATS